MPVKAMFCALSSSVSFLACVTAADWFRASAKRDTFLSVRALLSELAALSWSSSSVILACKEMVLRLKACLTVRSLSCIMPVLRLAIRTARSAMSRCPRKVYGFDDQ